MPADDIGTKVLEGRRCVQLVSHHSTSCVSQPPKRVVRVCRQGDGGGGGGCDVGMHDLTQACAKEGGVS